MEKNTETVDHVEHKDAHKILVVDDDVEITTLLTEYLARFGFATHAAGGAAAMHAQLEKYAIDLVVLDVMLPGTDGITLARELRQRSRVPIIMLTARADPYDRVLGLEMGADDYMSKPFEPRELVARIQTVMRRLTNEHPPVRLNFACCAPFCACRGAFSAVTSSWSRPVAGPWMRLSAASTCWCRGCAPSWPMTRARRP